MRVGPGTERGQGRGRGQGRWSHLTGLCSVATGSGLSWDSGAAARPGESPASMGNLRPCGGSWALMSRPRGALRGEWRSGHSRAAWRPLPAPAPPGRCSPAGGRGRSQAGSSCPSPGRGRTLRSRRSRAGVCGTSRPRRRGGGLHCDPGRGALTSQNPFLQLGNPTPPGHLARRRAGSWRAVALGSADPLLPDGGDHGTVLGIPGRAQTSAATLTGGATTHCLAQGRGTEVT